MMRLRGLAKLAVCGLFVVMRQVANGAEGGACSEQNWQISADALNGGAGLRWEPIDTSVLNTSVGQEKMYLRRAHIPCGWLVTTQYARIAPTTIPNGRKANVEAVLGIHTTFVPDRH